ncbi:sphingosine-1-phosphate phosphatase 1-like [Clavelina lepadiformis]|uniref:Phosphatidic acid phosphatase type 2/haloperoxidase domain-containing protein n=1 Tax=Clavelina lepadiformis TaxID=159417 RepID=A0ABP0FEM4_CLALP
MDALKFLNGPVPVAWFQYFCGVRWKNKNPKNQIYPASVAGCSNNVGEKDRNFIITNKTIFILAKAGSELAGEPFYYIFFPACSWIFEITLSRRTLMMLTASMYIGQSLKDVLKKPRPSSPPVIRMDEKYETEYGMPSTHTMCGVTAPFSLLLVASKFYQMPLHQGIVLSGIWSSAVMISRVYLGMHSIMETCTGAILSIILLSLYPTVAWLDESLVHSSLVSWCVGAGSFLLSWVVFQLDADIDQQTGLPRWNTARGDMAEILGWCAGFLIGSRQSVLSKTLMTHLSPTSQLQVLLPITEAGPSALRCLVRFTAGSSLLGPFGFMVRKLLLRFFVRVNGYQISDIKAAKRKPNVELPYKFLTTFLSGFVSTYVIPSILQYCNLW